MEGKKKSDTGGGGKGALSSHLREGRPPAGEKGVLRKRKTKSRTKKKKATSEAEEGKRKGGREEALLRTRKNPSASAA